MDETDSDYIDEELLDVVSKLSTIDQYRMLWWGLKATNPNRSKFYIALLFLAAVHRTRARIHMSIILLFLSCALLFHSFGARVIESFIMSIFVSILIRYLFFGNSLAKQP